MTTFHPETIVCGCCGHAFRTCVLGSTNAFGYCDLDMRPPEMARSTLGAQVRHCSSCGYCAVDIRQFTPELRPVIESEAYQEQLKSADRPTVASFFICAGMLRETVGDHEMAGRLFLKAAWVCDDKGRDDLARQWRSRAADQLLTALPSCDASEEGAGNLEAIIVDCLRRAGRVDKALELIQYAEGGACAPSARKVLAFQRVLIARGDTACHNAAEALKDG